MSVAHLRVHLAPSGNSLASLGIAVERWPDGPSVTESEMTELVERIRGALDDNDRQGRVADLVAHWCIGSE